MECNINPKIGDQILTGSEKYKHTISGYKDSDNGQLVLCGCTKYRKDNLRLVSKGGTKKYPRTTWRYKKVTK